MFSFSTFSLFYFYFFIFSLQLVYALIPYYCKTIIWVSSWFCYIFYLTHVICLICGSRENYAPLEPHMERHPLVPPFGGVINEALDIITYGSPDQV